jgi:hypothetical protein
MSLKIRRYLLALMLGVSGLSLAMPLTHNAAAFAENGVSNDSGSGSDEQQAANDDNSSSDNAVSTGDGAAGDDDDAGPVGGTAKGKFQDGCAIADMNCLNKTAN